jgi:ABC-type uncharacterized transport system YnjBCD permease subunit
VNEEEVLTQLRDIHLPAQLEQAVTSGFAGWPFAVLALLVCLILVLRLRNRGRWRRRARTDLSRILSVDDQATQWTLLLEFATGLSARSGRPVTLPHTAFMRPDDLSEQQRSEFIGFLHTEIGR